MYLSCFLMHIATYKDKGLNFIIGGATQASIRRNILDDMELILGRELTLDKSNAVKIFGNKVYVFDGQNSDAWKKHVVLLQQVLFKRGQHYTICLLKRYSHVVVTKARGY